MRPSEDLHLPSQKLHHPALQQGRPGIKKAQKKHPVILRSEAAKNLNLQEGDLHTEMGN
jgi:hypothetical protein